METGATETGGEGAAESVLLATWYEAFVRRGMSGVEVDFAGTSGSLDSGAGGAVEEAFGGGTALAMEYMSGE